MRAALFLWANRIVGCLMMSVGPAAWLLAQQELPDAATSSFTSLEPARSDWERPAHLVVVRVSADVLKNALNRHVDVTTSVREMVLGVPVSGLARMVGEPRVELVPSNDEARFNVVFSGTV